MLSRLFSWRPFLLGLALFAVVVEIFQDLRLDSDYLRVLLMITPLAIAYFAETRWRRRDFEHLAESFGAGWNPEGFWDVGTVDGELGGRAFSIFTWMDGRGRNAREWTKVRIACATGKTRFSIAGNSIRLLGSNWLARAWWGDNAPHEAMQRFLHADADFLRSKTGRAFQGGILATAGQAIEWRYNGYLAGSPIRRVLEYLARVAAEVERISAPSARPV